MNMKITQKLELDFQKKDFNNQILEIEYQKTKWEITQIEFENKRKIIILSYKHIVSEILVDKF